MNQFKWPCMLILATLAILPLWNMRALTPAPERDATLVEAPLPNTDGPSPQRPNTQGIMSIPTNRQGIPEDLQGKFPIQIPAYSEVEQLLVLSDRWVIVVTSNLDEVSQELQKLAAKDPKYQHIDFLQAQEDWKKSKIAGHYNWQLMRDYIERVMAIYLVQARENAGEWLLDNTDFYTIDSPKDDQYSAPRHPSRVTRFIVSRGGERVSGFNPDYAQYSYLELPQPMVSGNMYTIRLQNDKSVTFLYDEMQTVSRSIKVNQVGYLPDVTHKYAYLGGYLFEFGPLDFSHLKGNPFYVVNAETGDKVLTGTIMLRESNPRYTNQQPMSGEDVYQLDISALKNPGTYFLSIPGVGRSWPFKVAPDVYGEAFYNAMRGMFAQRCGIALTEEYSAWTRMQCHAEPTYENALVTTNREMHAPAFEEFDVVGATMDYSKSTPGPVYGWHDAADWDKSAAHYTPVFAMLALYEMAPQKFHDGQLHLPPLPEVGGSGDGIPDILNEAEFGLRVWSKSLNPDGGASGRWETWTHPTINDPTVHYGYGVRMQWLSLLYATAAAQFAHLIKPFDSNKAATYEEEARKAFAYGSSPKFFQEIFTMHAKTNRGSGEPYTITVKDNPAFHIPYLASAQLRLYILTQDKQYLNNLVPLLTQAVDQLSVPDAYVDYFPFLYYGILNPQIKKQLPESLQRKLLALYVQRAQWLTRQSDQDPYRRAKERKDQDLAWGWGVTTNRAKWLLIANHFSPDAGFRDAAVFNADYQMGTNPQGMMWTSGSGYVYPIHFQHAISEDDQIIDPFPGIQIYGPTQSEWRLISQIWNPKNIYEKSSVDAEGKPIIFLPPGNREGDYILLPPPLRRYATHPGFLVDQNEFTVVETMAGALFTYGMLMNDDWMPSEALKNRKPRADHLLFGYWYLP